MPACVALVPAPSFFVARLAMLHTLPVQHEKRKDTNDRGGEDAAEADAVGDAATRLRG